MALGLPHLGFGVGLRAEHISEILSSEPEVDWFEILSENVMDSQGRALALAEAVAERYPVVLHGVSMNIGSSDPLDWAYLDRLMALAERLKPAWISDHLCFTGLGGHNSHDLLPMVYSEASLEHVVGRIQAVQRHLDRPLVLENPSSYIRFKGSTIDEWSFMTRMAKESGCGLLVDVNNVAVSAFNHGWDPERYLESLPAEQIVQLHLAGHSDLGTHRIDTHDGPVSEEVWRLYQGLYTRIGGASTLVEWDADIPTLEVLIGEARAAKELVSGGAIPSRAGQPSSARLSHPLARRIRPEGL